jgi:hypothetical protein
MTSKRIPKITNKLILKFWRSRMNTADIAKRLGMTEAEIVQILEKAKNEERNKNRIREATVRQSTLESVQGWAGVSVARVRFLEEKSGLGDSRPGKKQKDKGALQIGNESSTSR